MHYPNIDMRQTGIRIQQLIKESGYTVKQIQEYLHLSCPQPIYRWFKGQILPALDHVYAVQGCNPIRIPRHEPIKKVYIELVKSVVESEEDINENIE